ncbi:hypothetical protein [Streptomyces sp. NPDC048350]|uniref:hypothetical protein n=1 Tax=Streptomyces sp. NPDC048350 TaxID=3365538 RepID=UPI00371A6EE6
MEIAGAIGGVAAGIGLLFTGVVTYYSVEVSQDQLDQKAKDDEKEISAQANQVDVRLETLTPGPVLVIENYSRQTIRNVSAPIVVTRNGEEKVYEVGSEVVPPCMSKSIAFARLGEKNAAFKYPGGYYMLHVHFEDSNGRWWTQRHSETSPSEYEERVKDTQGSTSAIPYGEMSDMATTSRLPDC